jgi:hypothetical protein
MTSITLDCKQKNVGDIIEWCYRHCGDGFDFETQFPSYRWVFKFGSPQDLTLFQLRWQ